VVFTTYEGLFAAIGAASAALTGLLFVAISVAPKRGPATGPMVIQQIRAAAALLCFVNALAVSLYGLVPDGNIGYPALTLGVIGIVFTAAAVRSVLSSGNAPRQKLAQLGLFTLLLLIFGTGVVSGIAVIANPHDLGQVQVIGYALVSSLVVGISRAWELIGDRDTSLYASLELLVGRTPHADRVGIAEPPATGHPDASAAQGGGSRQLGVPDEAGPDSSQDRVGEHDDHDGPSDR
jgi:hypothetical protein